MLPDQGSHDSQYVVALESLDLDALASLLIFDIW